MISCVFCCAANRCSTSYRFKENHAAVRITTIVLEILLLGLGITLYLTGTGVLPAILVSSSAIVPELLAIALLFCKCMYAEGLPAQESIKEKFPEVGNNPPDLDHKKIKSPLAQKADEELRQRELEKKQKADEELRQRELEKKQKADEELRQRELERKQKADEELRQRELERKQKADEELRQRELEKKQKADEELRQRELEKKQGADEVRNATWEQLFTLPNQRFDINVFFSLCKGQLLNDEDYQNRDAYQKHAQFLLMKFLKMHPEFINSEAIHGLQLIALIIAIKNGCEAAVWLVDFKKLLASDPQYPMVVSMESLRCMEIEFLKAIDWDVGCFTEEELDQKINELAFAPVPPST